MQYDQHADFFQEQESDMQELAYQLELEHRQYLEELSRKKFKRSEKYLSTHRGE